MSLYIDPHIIELILYYKKESNVHDQTMRINTMNDVGGILTLSWSENYDISLHHNDDRITMTKKISFNGLSQ